jgi:hypothetical protein
MKASSSCYDDTIVIRDPQTQQLSLRGTGASSSSCPTCHRPFRDASPERQSSPHRRSTHFISPEYFRMLHDTNVRTDVPPSSPIRRLVEPAFSSTPISLGSSVADAEFVTSTPDPEAANTIKKDAFSPDYFKRFFIIEKELGRGGKGVVLLVRHELDSVCLGMVSEGDCVGSANWYRSICLQESARRRRSCVAGER